VLAAESREVMAVWPAFKNLQSVHDIRGVAIKVNEDEPVTISEGRAFYVGAAFADWMAENVDFTDSGGMRVAIGMDPRLSGGEIAGGLTAGLCSKGAVVTLVGLASSPAMFMSTVTNGFVFAGAIMVTAGELPPHWNGMKLFTSRGGLMPREISEVLETAAVFCAEAGGDPDCMDTGMDFFSGKDSYAEYNQMDFMGAYADQLRNLIKMGVSNPESYDMPLSDMKIVVNAGNGSGGFFATDVLEQLGADISGSLHLEPDGNFPNGMPNPASPEMMEATTKAVRSSGADLGICFDTDVDRSAVVDEQGKPISGNRFIALMAAITLARHPGSTVVTDSVTSNGLSDFISRLGGRHIPFRRGSKNVIRKGMELNIAGESCELMMDTSGHCALMENFFQDDGAYAAVKVVIEAALRKRLAPEEAGISMILEALQEPLELREFRLVIKADDFFEKGKDIVDTFYKAVGRNDMPNWRLAEVSDGDRRVNVDEGDGKAGWIILRQSMREPFLVVTIESEINGGVASLAHSVYDLIKKQGLGNVEASSLLTE